MQKPNFFLKTIIFYFFVFITYSLSAQNTNTGNILLQNYKAKKDYNGHTQNWTIMQSPTGLMYIGNNDGLIEYDGKNFRTIASPGTMRSLAIDKNGILYGGAKSEFGYFQTDLTGKLTYTSLSANLDKKENNFGNVWKIYINEDRIYFCTFEGVFLYKNFKFIRSFRPKTAFFVSFMVANKIYTSEAKKGLLVLDTNIESDTFNVIKGSEMFGDGDKVYNIFPHPTTNDKTDNKNTNKVIVATRKKGFHIFNSTESPANFTKFPVEIDSVMIKNKFVRILRDSKNKIIVATTAGVIVANEGGNLENLINKESGLQDNNVWDINFDKQEGIWIALNNGLARAQINYPITYWNENHGLEGNKAYCITKFENTIYVGTSQGVFCVVGNRLEKVVNSASQVWSFIQLKTGNKTVLLYGDNTGISEIRNKQARSLHSSSANYALLQPNKNMNLFYAGSRDGVAILEYQNEKITVKGKLEEVTTEVRALKIDSENNIWAISPRKGVISLQKVNLTTLQAEKVKILGKESGLIITSDMGLEFFENKVFVCNENKIFEIDTNFKLIPVEKFNKRIAKENIGISELRKDSNGQLWLGGAKENQGKSFTFVAYFDKENQLQDKVFRRLPNMEITAIYADSNKVMWIAGSEGLFRYDGNQEFKPSTDFTTLIRKVTLGNDSVIFNGNYTELVNGNFNILANQAQTNVFSLKYADNDLRFEYACPFFDNEFETQYSYKLEGFDDKWSEWTKETKKEYTNLFEKKYKFRVKAKNVYGDESKETVYELTILPPWYRTWWAYLMYILLAGAGVWGIVRVNSARLKVQNVKLEKTVKERTIEITHKNQELEQQKEEILAQNDAILEKNNKLGIAFQEINQQKEEIEAQRDNLEMANQEINQQKEEIESQRDNIAAQKQAVEKAYDNIQILSEIGQKITSILDIKTIIHTVYENVNQLMSAEAFGIGIYYPKTKEIYFEGFVEKGEILPKHFHKLGEKVLAVKCFNEQKSIFINHLSSEYQNYFDEPLQGVAAGEIPQSVIYLPLTLENKTIGVITVQSFKANAYTNFHLTMLNSLASYIAIALDNAGAYQIIDAKNTQITGSIRYAQTIQQAILPSKELLNAHFAEHFVLYQPKDVVSGDFYWLSLIKNKETQIIESVFLGLMDCTGHGVPGAFMSLIGNTLLNKIVANNPKILPAQLLDELHSEIKIALNQDDESNKDGMDTCLIKFDYQTKSDLPNVFFAGAKRPLYIVTQKGELIEYKGSRKSIGGKQRDDLFFDNKSVSLGKGDTIYFTTDGYADQNNNVRESMGSNFFKEFLLTIYQEKMSKQHELLLKRLNEHQDEEEQRDDISVIGVRL